MLAKTLLALGFIGTAVVTPIASMGVSPVREALLGLAPEEQIIQLADEIDKDRVANEQRISELQVLVSAQESMIDEQKKALDEQKIDQEVELAKQKAEQTEISSKLASVSNAANCTELYRKNSFCSQERYRTKKAFDKETNESEKRCDNLSERSSDRGENCLDNVKEEMSERKEHFDICQDVIAQCN